MNEYLVDGDAPYKCVSRNLDQLAKKIKNKTAIPKEVVTSAGERIIRQMALIEVSEYFGSATQYSSIGKYWVDCVTGTLYDPVTGKSLSSDQMRLVIPKKSKV